MSIDETACDARVLGKDCPHGSWCCLNGSKTECVTCDHKIFGKCLSTSHQTCEAHSMKSWNQLADIEQYLYDAGEKVGKDAVEAVCKKYNIPQCENFLPH